MAGRHRKPSPGLGFALALLVLIILTAAIAGCGRQCPPGFINDGRDNCVSDGSGRPMEDDFEYEEDDD